MLTKVNKEWKMKVFNLIPETGDDGFKVTINRENYGSELFIGRDGYRFNFTVYAFDWHELAQKLRDALKGTNYTEEGVCSKITFSEYESYLEVQVLDKEYGNTSSALLSEAEVNKIIDELKKAR